MFIALSKAEDIRPRRGSYKQRFEFSINVAAARLYNVAII